MKSTREEICIYKWQFRDGTKIRVGIDISVWEVHVFNAYYFKYLWGKMKTMKYTHMEDIFSKKSTLFEFEFKDEKY